MSDKIKEKGPVRKELKEKVKAAPKELLRRGLLDGTQRLRGQLRDTAQRGQQDGYGGEQLEDAVWRGGRWGERGIEKLLKKKKADRGRPTDGSPSAPPEPPAKQPSGEFILPEAPEHPASADGSERMRIRTRETSYDMRTTPLSSGRQKPSDQPAIKTREAHVRRQSVPLSEQPAQATERGRRKFQREQGEKAAAKRFGECRAMPEPPPMSLVGGDKPPVQRSSPWRQIAQSGDAPIFARGRTVSPATFGGKRAVKVSKAGTKSVGRTAHQGVKTAEYSAKRVLKSTDRVKTAGQTAQAASSAYKRAIQTFRATKKPAAATVKGAVKAGTAALRATVRTTRTLAAALAAGGSVVVSVVLVLCLVGVLVASPFGIFFSGGNGSPDAVSPSAAAVQINGELSNCLSALQVGGTYDRVEILGQPPAWSDVFAVFAAKTTADGVDVVTLDTARLDLLRAVFWDMTKITTLEEEVEHPAVGSTPAWTENVLKITITPRTTDDMQVFYSFTDGQNQALDALLANGGMLAALAGDLTISSQDAKALLAALPPDLDPERRAVVETACQLVGKVNYFWGGKSRVLGWDERWGQIRKVTASGSSTSGTYRPFGLDCSGFVDWVFYNVTGGSYVIGHGGGAHAQHGYCTAITWDQAIPGDLVFYPGDTHVGIVGGRDESGNLLIIHCTYSKDNVVITGKSGFTSIARPNYYSD